MSFDEQENTWRTTRRKRSASTAAPCQQQRAVVFKWESKPEVEGDGRPHPRPRSGHTMVVHEPEGKAIMFGGLGGDETTYGDPVLNDVWLFDVHTEAWSELRTYGEYPIPVFGHTAEIIDTDPANLSMLVFGGQSFGGTMASDTVVLFGVLSEYPFWRKLATQQAVNRSLLSRWGHTMVAVREAPGGVSLLTQRPVPATGNVQLVVFGGMAEAYESLDDIIVFDVAEQRWSKLDESDDGDARACPPPAPHGPGTDLTSAPSPLPPPGLLSPLDVSAPPPDPVPPPSDDKKLAAAYPRPAGRRRHIAALDKTKTKMWVFGGRSQWNHFHSDLWCFDLKTLTWREVIAAGSPLPRTGHCGSMYGTRLYIFGGFELRGPIDGEWDYVLHNDLHCFDTLTLEWKQIKPEKAGFAGAAEGGTEARALPHRHLLQKASDSAADRTGDGADLSNDTTGGTAMTEMSNPGTPVSSCAALYGSFASDSSEAAKSASSSAPSSSSLSSALSVCHQCPDMADVCTEPRQRSMSSCFIFQGRLYIHGGRDKHQAFHCAFSIPLKPPHLSTLVEHLSQFLVDCDIAYHAANLPTSLSDYLDSLFAPQKARLTG